MAAAYAPTDEIRGPGYVLRYAGSIREAIMTGKRDAVLDLRTLKGTSHLWGLGALGGLTGEITIADGLSLLARVGTNRSIQVTELATRRSASGRKFRPGRLRRCRRISGPIQNLRPH
jgi:hypothetical protein